MRNRDYKQFAQGQYYHIYNRGNGKKNIFKDANDYHFFMLRLRQNLFPDEKVKTRLSLLPPDSFSLISYCLMPNHFHFLIRQNANIPMTKLMSRLSTSYSIYFNRKYEKVGHVFQDQYKQVIIDDSEYLVWLSAYIHQNPKVANLVERSEDYEWSSYPEYIGKVGEGICDKMIILEQFANNPANSTRSTRMTLVNRRGVNYKDFVAESFGIIKQRKDLACMLLEEIGPQGLQG